jgi:DNA-binding NtrC family response regulator
MQVKLLRVIDSGEYIPLGSNVARRTDVRIIAATNKNLRDLVREGLIREDFFYRIHIIPIHLPPLRERKEDIPLLIDHFMRLHGETDKNVGRINMDRFLDHEWPGNVRELQNVIHRYISMKKLDFGGSRPSRKSLDLPEMSSGTGLAEMMDACEKAIIKKTLDEWKWHRGKAAEILGINRKTLFMKIQKYGIDHS